MPCPVRRGSRRTMFSGGRAEERADGPRPSGKFTANAVWLALACLAFNVLRAAGAAASVRHAKARWATLRTHLVAVPARVASSARRLVLHLPTHWP